MVRGSGSHTGAGRSNADYYCFGRPVLAPGFGHVVVAVDSVRDNNPGAMNPQSPPGNHVIIDHGNGELKACRRSSTTTLRMESRLSAARRGAVRRSAATRSSRNQSAPKTIGGL